MKIKTHNAFSLVEVTIALGLVAYALMALLGLFAVGVSSSRESNLETIITQISLDAFAKYDGTEKTLAYSYEGVPSETAADKYFDVEIERVGNVPDASDNLHLLKIAITSERDARLKKIIQNSVFIP